jgi:signal transduction histidine kinase
MRRPFTIRTRLTLWYGAVLATTVVALGIVLWLSVGAILRGAVDEALHVQAADVRSGIASDPRVAVSALDPGQPGLFTVVYGPRGEIRSRSAAVPLGFREPVLGTTTERPSPTGPEYAVTAEPADDRQTIVVGTSLAPIDHELESLALPLVGFGCIAGVASLLGGWLLSGRALAPVGRLTREADAIGATDLDRRLPEPARPDEIGRLTQTLNGMLDRVAAVARRERFFVSAASHDLRTPIASLRTELELASRLPTDGPSLREAVRIAHADAVRLSALAADLLGLAEAESTGRSLVLQPIAVRDLVDSAITTVQPLAIERSVRLVSDASEAIVEVDRVRLEQALVNLLGNAIRVAPAESAVEVAAEVRREAGVPASAAGSAASWPGPAAALKRRPVSLSVQVLDRGPGVSASVRPLLFVPFAARAQGRPDGTGLGLATAAAAVRAHGGEIGYEDRPGGGASFWLRVPTTEVRPPGLAEVAIRADDRASPGGEPEGVPGWRPLRRRSARPRTPSPSR